jgi:hypothetical protein
MLSSVPKVASFFSLMDSMVSLRDPKGSYQGASEKTAGDGSSISALVALRFVAVVASYMDGSLQRMRLGLSSAMGVRVTLLWYSKVVVSPG